MAKVSKIAPKTRIQGATYIHGEQLAADRLALMYLHCTVSENIVCMMNTEIQL